jgi:hypothetical protein
MSQEYPQNNGDNTAADGKHFKGISKFTACKLQHHTSSKLSDNTDNDTAARKKSPFSNLITPKL